MNIDQFKKEKGETSWFYSPDGELEIVIEGDDSGPDRESFILAERLMPILKDCESKAVHLLESFMKDKGDWELCTVSFVDVDMHKGCVFTLDFGFVSDQNRHEYNYTGFLVCFSWPLSNPAPLDQPHPFKFSVEFS